MKKHGRADVLVTDKLRSYGAALKHLGVEDRQETGRLLNNRAENSHLPFRRRERAMLRLASWIGRIDAVTKPLGRSLPAGVLGHRTSLL